MQPSNRSRLLSGAGAAIIVGLTGCVLLFGLGVGEQVRVATSIALRAIAEPVPPEPPPTPRIEALSRARTAARPSEPNVRNKATLIVTPRPRVTPLAPSAIVVATVAGTGIAASAGAADRPGTGEGAGGTGDRTGAGDAGDGDGSGGGDTPPRQIKGRLRFVDLPRDLLDQAVGGTVAVRYDVDATGGVINCTVTGSSGNAELDAVTCQLIERRFRFAPARTTGGEPTVSTIEETHRWTTERSLGP